MTKFLIDEKGFSEERVFSIKKRLANCHIAKPQMSLESFFGKPQKKDNNDKQKITKKGVNNAKSGTKTSKK